VMDLSHPIPAAIFKLEKNQTLRTKLQIPSSNIQRSTNDQAPTSAPMRLLVLGA
jgi:hypothetical protein